MPTYAQTRQGYINLWTTAVIRPEYLRACRQWAQRIINGQRRYKLVEQKTGVPWFFIGLLHMREGSCDFGTYLGNGEPLSSVTRLVPAGRGPFKTFEAGAIDALTLQGFTTIRDWPISRILYSAEVFNGEGYEQPGININSPYVWSWTNHYGTRPNIGKFVGDGQFSRTAIDAQAGIAAILGSLIVMNAEVASYLATYKEEPVAETTPPNPAPAPASQPGVPPTDPDAMLIAYLQAKGKWPAPGAVSITTSGEVTVMVNGKAV